MSKFNSDKDYVMYWMQNHVWSRPKPSTICDGIGMFAIRDIPKGTSIYDLADRSVYGWITWDEAKTLPKGVLEWILESQPHAGSEVCEDSFNWTDKMGPVWMYTMENLNWQTTWFFQNHSTNPNVIMETTSNPRLFKYYAIRDITEGEELLEDYGDYTDSWKT